MIKNKWPVLLAFAFSGAAALIYEVAWTRSLALVLGSTTYALSTMLGTFMAGLALGGWIGGRLADRHKNLLMVFGLLELGIGVFGLITVPLINSMPPLYFRIFKSFAFSPTVFFVAQFLLCAGIMLVPTTLMGATFPVVSKKVTEAMEVMGKGVGNAYSFNTLGAIVGSLSAGFLLIPLVGIKAATLTAASLNVIVALSMILLSRARMKGTIIAVLIVALSTPFAGAIVSKTDEWYPNFYLAERVGSYGDWAKSQRGLKVLYEKDHREGRVKLWKDWRGNIILQVGGKIEGTAFEDMANTLLLAYLPIASHPGPKSFLTIGLGAGVTLGGAKQHIRDNYLVEINRGVIEAMREFGPEGLLDGVDIKINDARNYLLLTDRKFDIISSEPSYPTEAATANLFTKEHYELASERLNPGGIYCQWLPYYQLSNDDVTMMLRTFGSVFENVYLWKTYDSLDLLMVGSNEPFKYDSDEIIKRTIELSQKAGGVQLTESSFLLSRNPEQVRAIVRERTDIPLNTDDNPFLEFHAAMNQLTGLKD